MRTVFFAAGMLVCAVVSVAAESDITVGYEQHWKDPDCDFSSFEAIYLRGIDLRGMEIRITEIDDEMDEEVTVTSLDTNTLSDIGVEMYRRFSGELGKVLPALDYETEPADLKERKALIIELALAGTFESQERGLLMDMLSGRNDREADPTLITVECRLFGPDGRRAIVILSDEHGFSVGNKSEPFRRDDEKEQLFVYMDIWARRLANFLALRVKEMDTVLIE